MFRDVGHVTLRSLRVSTNIELIHMLRAYFDDSGKLEDPAETVAVVAGCIAEVKNWDQLEVEWVRVLKEFSISEFHASDFAHSVNDFVGWEEPRRRNLCAKLGTIVEQYVLKPIGAMLPLDQFQGLPLDRQREWGNPYFVCLQDSIETAAKTAMELFSLPEYVQIICDEQPKFKAMANNVYQRAKKHLHVGSRLAGFDFAKSILTPGLQAADWVAFEALQLRRDLLNPEYSLDKMRWPMKYFLDKKMCDFEFYSAQALSKRIPLPLLE